MASIALLMPLTYVDHHNNRLYKYDRETNGVLARGSEYKGAKEDRRQVMFIGRCRGGVKRMKVRRVCEARRDVSE